MRVRIDELCQRFNSSLRKETPLSDSREHSYSVTVDRPTGELTIAVRVTGEFENHSVQKTPVKQSSFIKVKQSWPGRLSFLTIRFNWILKRSRGSQFFLRDCRTGTDGFQQFGLSRLQIH